LSVERPQDAIELAEVRLERDGFSPNTMPRSAVSRARMRSCNSMWTAARYDAAKAAWYCAWASLVHSAREMGGSVEEFAKSRGILAVARSRRGANGCAKKKRLIPEPAS